MRTVAVRRIQHLSRTLATHATPSQTTGTSNALATRHDWSRDEIQKIYDTPLMELVFRAASVHRQYHDPSKIQLCTLMNIKSESISRFISRTRLTHVP